MDKKRLEHPIFLIVQLVDRTFATSQTNALVTHPFSSQKAGDSNSTYLLHQKKEHTYIKLLWINLNSQIIEQDNPLIKSVLVSLKNEHTALRPLLNWLYYLCDWRILQSHFRALCAKQKI
ncbi:hypothetical protein OSF83_001440 [Enterococcus hirae]|nr:hypothetical protein [Enterococcus hirae]EMF0050764.1 hypothetical protein [Enterococcus hirae]EMF0082324.1 hypothetical protein [Enterococcus hirae]EMF0093211.1 hypothetical protein [Enterococcus hirae]EMF0098682.1 hypothetical protein [Enterococcus hirae]EMF0101816.1 hypothetical protein [Enterococcus hirae]